jgi:enoyl-CoA hydratase/carnithine racemase
MALEPLLRLSLVGRKERMNAQRALQLGVISEVVPQAQLVPRALELAQLIAQNSPAACARTKRAIWESLNLPLDDAREMGWQVIEEYWTHPDIKEGARAFAEKRKPNWAES